MARRTGSTASRKSARQLSESGHEGRAAADEARAVVDFSRAMIPAPATSKRDREFLTRFYSLGQSQSQICAQMGLTDTQYRLLKSRAENRYDQELIKGRLSRTRVSAPNASNPGTKTKKATLLAGRLLPIAAHAVAVFGDEHKAAHWFATPLALLGNRSPEEVFDDKGGAEIVDRILTRIEHNIPS